ncbi:MAG: Fic family protein [Acidobacteriota bacterium]
MKFLEGLSEDIRKTLLEQLRVLWTHTSTAIEGNTLTLGETAFVLSEGLTVQGKPLKDHRDVEGHARAVDFMVHLVHKDEITADDLFALHRLVITDPILDVYKPVGGWKKENNSTSITVENRLMIVEFSDHWKIPEIMDRWLRLLNEEMQPSKEPEAIIESYARLHVSFASIHPFYDGNGRIARLISNLPCLKSGYPPIIIDKAKRYDYIKALAEYQRVNGVPDRDTPLVHEDAAFKAFSSFCRDCWNDSIALVERAHALQRDREARLRKEQGGAESP